MMNFKERKIYLACGATDMRKQINGLASLVESNFKLKNLDSTLFVFCGNKREQIKILEWDKDGFWLHTRRLEYGTFNWPNKDGANTMNIDPEEFEILLRSPGVRHKLKCKSV